MRILIKTPIQRNYLEIYNSFDRVLFEYLLPSFPKVKIVRFDGSKKGDIVHMRFPLNIKWISLITEDFVSNTEAYFIDEGQKLPPGLKYWKHKHKIEKVDEENSVIVDDITFEGNARITSFLLYPVLYGSFYPRKSAYKSYFNLSSTIKNR